MIRKKVSIFLIVVMLFNISIGCGDNKKTMIENKIEYSEIYKNTPIKAPIISGADVYKASYGYNLAFEQGYNGFFYQSGKMGEYRNLDLSGKIFKSGDIEISGGAMKSGKDGQAVRTFVSAVVGKVNIYGNPYLLSGSLARITILHNDKVIVERDITDNIGIYHSDNIVVGVGDKIHFCVSGNVYWNPTVDFIMAQESSLHNAPDGFYGDVHPFYDENTGKLYMYYLSTGNQTESKVEAFSSLLSVSDNFISYTPTALKMDLVNPPEQDLYYALGIYKDNDGNYRSSYGKGNYAGGSVSKDLINWSNGSEAYIDESDGMFKYTYRAYFDSDVNSGRDPDVFFDKESNTHYMVVMNYYSSETHAGKKGLSLYMAGADGRFSTKAVKLLDCTGRGDPECPQLKKIGERWYLFYSIYGTGTVGGVGNLRYRVGDKNTTPDKVNWSNKEELSLDGGDLHASQLTQVKDKFYMYGWIGYSAHANVWGGFLNLAREVYSKEDGTLGTRCDEYLTKLLNKGEIATFKEDNTSVSSMTAVNGKFMSSGNGAVKLNGDYNRNLLFANITLPKDSNYAGYCFEQGSQKYYAGIVRNNGEIYLTITTNMNNPFDGVSIKLNDSTLTDFKLKVIIDNNFIEAFVNEEVSLTANTLLTAANYSISIVAYNKAVVDKAKVCKLSDLNNIFD